MPLTHERLPDESIVIFSFGGKVSLEDQREMYALSARILEATREHLYRLSNYTGVTSTFAEVMGIVREIGTGLPGSITDSRITAVLVGQHQWTRLALDMLKQPQFGGIQAALFNTVEDGLTALRLVKREVQRAREIGDRW